MDCFALLDQPRRPWLAPEALKQKFLALSAEVHPDRVHGASDEERRAAQQRYTQLNSAYNRLREPKERLLHLLELELGSKPPQVQSIPPDLMNRFMEVSGICREADGFLAEKAKTVSPLLQVQLFDRNHEFASKLLGLQKSLNAGQEELMAELRALDELWTQEPDAERKRDPNLLQRMQNLYRLFSYYSRWTSQIQERLLQLSL